MKINRLDAAVLLALATACLWSGPASGLSVKMVPNNDSDGKYDVVKINGKDVCRAVDEGKGVYAGFIYFKRPAGAQFKSGATLYAEADFVDVGGPGRIGMQYNAVGNDYQGCGFMFNSSVKNTGAVKTAVFKLEDADLKGKSNAGADLRLTRDGNLRLHVLELRVSDAPNPIYRQQTAFLGPYRGPAYAGDHRVDSSTIKGKVIVGYQGWFRTPDDDGDCGWTHYTNAGGMFTPKTLAVDCWPDMTEYTVPERHPVAGFTLPDGTTATVFSSDSFRTVLRHFQWMETWGIDGVAVQRFVGGLANPDIETLRVLTYIREAANRTGRAYFVEYDMTGCPAAELAPNISKDWHYLVDTLQLTSDPSYLRQGGLPVAGVYGFFHDRFSTQQANAIVDIFQKDKPHRAFFAGAGEWPWRGNFSPEWKKVVWRMGSWQPWNTGNAGGSPKYVNTNNWAPDKAELDAHRVMFIPQIYPGGSADNRSHTKFGTYFDDRLKGDFLWKQFAAATQLKAASVFLGMFDELDEGTQIFKATSAFPREGHFIGYDLPSDCYLCYTSQGTKMFRGEIPYSLAKPDCPSMTKPSSPEPLTPGENARVKAGAALFSWSQAFSAQGTTAAVDGYEMELDGAPVSLKAVSRTASVAAGAHSWRVRARNTLKNWSGWSQKTPFVAAP